MFFRAFCICVFISVTHQQFLKYLPTSDDIRNSKVNKHKQTLCMIKVGREICYNGSQSPGDAKEVAELFKIIKYGDSGRVQQWNGGVKQQRYREDIYESAISDDDSYSEEDRYDDEEDEEYDIRKL